MNVYGLSSEEERTPKNAKSFDGSEKDDEKEIADCHMIRIGQNRN